MKKITKIFKVMIATIGFAIGIPLLVFFWYIAPDEAPKTDPKKEILSQARYQCKALLEDNLKDPKSAEWGMNSGNWYQSWPASIDSGTISVIAKFRAKNGFGALTLNQFICKFDMSGKWNVLDFSEY